MQQSHITRTGTRAAAALLLAGAIACNTDRIAEPARPSAPVVRSAGQVKPSALITPASQNPFGINLPYDTDLSNMPAFLDTLAQANVGWVRVMMGWNDAEHTRGVLDGWQYQQVRQIAQMVQARGLKMFLQLRVDAPAYAGGSDVEGSHFGPTCAHWADWQSYVHDVVADLGQFGVTHYSIHNESASPDMWTPQCGYGSWGSYSWPTWANDYLEAVLRAGRAMHGLGPQYKLIFWESGAGDAPVNAGITWVIDIMDALQTLTPNEPDPVDIIGIHHYAGSGPNDPYFLNSADLVQADMQIWAQRLSGTAHAQKELWLTEYGTDPMGYVPAASNQYFGEREKRNVETVILSQFIKRQNLSQWTKLFPFNDDGRFGWTRGLQIKTPQPLTMLEPFWAYGYLARRYGGDSGINYTGFQFDNRTWYSGSDGVTVPPFASGSSNGIWGAQLALNPWLKRAGVLLCAQYNIQFIGWLNGAAEYCNGEQIGPIEFSGQPHNIQGIQYRMLNPLPAANKTWISLCNQSNVDGLGWRGACSSSNFAMIGQTTQMRALKQFFMFLAGDIR